MATKQVLYFDEEAEAEKIFKEGFGGKLDYGRIYIVAKYMRQKMNLGAKRLEKELISFCEKEDKNFNAVLDRDLVRKWVNSAMNYDLRIVRSVGLTQKEIDTLASIEKSDDRKVLFVILVFSKAVKKGYTIRKKGGRVPSKRYYLKNHYLSDIVRLSGINRLSITNLCYIIYDNRELFSFYSPEREICELMYVDVDGEEVFEVDDLENMMNSYNELFTENETLCSVCGEPFDKTGNNQKYCSDCAKVQRNKKMADYMQKYRAKQENKAEIEENG